MPEGEIVLGIDSVLALLNATEDDEDSRLATRLRGVINLIEPVGTFVMDDYSNLTPEGYPHIINVQDPHPDISSVAAVGDGTDDLTALQNVCDWVKTKGTQGYVVWFPHMQADGQTATYTISAPLKVYSETRLRGPASIGPTADFDFGANSDTSVVELYSANSIRNGLGRLLIYDLQINGRGLADSRCLLANLQQPSIITKLRCNDFKGVGITLSGQQAQFYETMLIGSTGPHSGVGLELTGGCKFMTFEGFNAEKLEVAVQHNADGPNWFKSIHLEPNSTDHPNAIGFEMLKGSVYMRDGWATMDETTQTVFKATSSAYTIENWVFSNAVDVTAINDTTRSIDLKVWTDFRRRINYFAAPGAETSYTYNQPNIWTLWGDDGRVTKLGGMEPADPGALWQAGTTQTADMAQWVDSGGTKRFSIDDTAHPVLPSYTDANRPAANSVPAGAIIWNTDDNAPNYSDGTNWRTAAGATT